MIQRERDLLSTSSHDRKTRRFAVSVAQRRIFGSCVRATLVVAALILVPTPGCRSIVKFGESRQSVAARRLSRQGLKAARQGDWNVAEDLFSKSLDVSDNNDAAHRGLADTLWLRGRRNEAIVHLKQAVQLSAGDPKHLQRLGRMYLELGRVDEAARQCEIALQSDREWAALWALWGDCEMAQDRSESALAAYHRALSLQPDYPYVQLQAAEIYHQQRRHDRLLATLDRFNESSSSVLPNQSDGGMIPGRADLLRGLAYRELGREDEAERYLIAAAEKNPADVTARLQLAASSITGGDSGAAQNWLAQAMRIDPEAVAASGWVRSGIDISELASNTATSALDDPSAEISLPSAYQPPFGLSRPGDQRASKANSRMAIGPAVGENR